MDSSNFPPTVPNVDLQKFVGKWYVVAGRFSFLENGAHNPVEEYSWGEKPNSINVNFTFRKDAFDGKLKTIPQKATVFDTKNNSHWKIQLLWIFKADYLILALADDYSWTAVGVPGGRYVWIMAKDYNMSDETLNEIIAKLDAINYNTKDIERAPHKWD